MNERHTLSIISFIAVSTLLFQLCHHEEGSSCALDLATGHQKLYCSEQEFLKTQTLRRLLVQMGFLLGCMCIRKLLLAVLPLVLRRLFIKSVQIFELATFYHGTRSPYIETIPKREFFTRKIDYLINSLCILGRIHGSGG